MIYMADALYMTDSYLKEWEAVVEEVSQGKYIVLDRTAFFPKGGGLPYDTGVMKRVSDSKEFRVVFVGKFSGRISHEVDREGLEKGDKVRCVLDWDNRYALMRHHTASHLLSAVFHKGCGALITGNQLGVERSRVDYNIEHFDREKIAEYVEETNKLIGENLPVEIEFMEREEAMKIPGIVKLAGALPPDVKTLRIVKIGDVDIQADGGPHVRNTKEVGKVKMVGLENKGKNNRRVYFVLEK
jgi:Ser-tRNA(Ala) deacylase AlaX